MSAFRENAVRLTVGAVWAALTVYLGYGVERAGFLSFIAAYAVFFALYFWVVFLKKSRSPGADRWWVATGILLRIILLFSIPNLSDDFYRFLWDGHLTVAGIHPFAHPPAYYMDNRIFPAGITPELFAQLNSPQYHTVYPPVCQAVFALAAWCGGENIWAGVLVLKLFLLAGEVGTIWLLGWGAPPGPPDGGKMGHSPDVMGENEGVHLVAVGEDAGGAGGAYSAAVAYALNPLIILEIVGNCHFEGAMIFFLLAGWRALERQKAARAAGWWALATATKLLPLMFLPILWFRLGRQKRLRFGVAFTGACLLLFLPLLSVLPSMFSSLDLYFRQFQFNGSVYNLMRGLGFLLKGFDPGETLGPLLGLVTVLGVLMLAYPTPGPSPTGSWGALPPVSVEVPGAKAPLPVGEGPGSLDPLLFALFLQLTHSATVHPWYVTVLLALGLGTRWRFPVVWTGLVALSYSHYAGGLFRENYWLIALEYALLWVYFLREMKILPLFGHPGAGRRSSIVSRQS